MHMGKQRSLFGRWRLGAGGGICRRAVRSCPGSHIYKEKAMKHRSLIQSTPYPVGVMVFEQQSPWRLVRVREFFGVPRSSVARWVAGGFKPIPQGAYSVVSIRWAIFFYGPLPKFTQNVDKPALMMGCNLIQNFSSVLLVLVVKTGAIWWPYKYICVHTYR